MFVNVLHMIYTDVICDRYEHIWRSGHSTALLARLTFYQKQAQSSHRSQQAKEVVEEKAS
jgi:hypothetical protein